MGILANSASVAMTSSVASDSRAGFVAAERITLSVNPGGTNYVWSKAGPDGSSVTRAALSATTGPTPSFVPDIAGTYTLVCTVDSVTTYVLRIAVTQVVTATSTEALRLNPLQDEQVAAPVLGMAVYHSATLGGPAYKSPDNSVRPLGSTQILDLFATSQAQVLGVAVAPGWQVIGGFRMAQTTDMRLDAIGAVSDPALTMTVRLYCVTPGAVGVVPGSVTDPITSTTDVEVMSGAFTLPGNRLYQVQAQAVGGAAPTYFGTVRRTAPASAAPLGAGSIATATAVINGPFPTITGHITRPVASVTVTMAATITSPTASCSGHIATPGANVHATIGASISAPTANCTGHITGAAVTASMAATITSPTASCSATTGGATTFLPGYLEFLGWTNADYAASITRKQFAANTLS